MLYKHVILLQDRCPKFLRSSLHRNIVQSIAFYLILCCRTSLLHSYILKNKSLIYRHCAFRRSTVLSTQTP